MRSVRLEKREPARERCAFKGGTEGALFYDRHRPFADFLFSYSRGDIGSSAGSR